MTYPITTIRTRFQQNQLFKDKKKEKYNSISNIFIRCFKDEGVRGFYKGVMINLAKGVPQKGIYFYFY